QDGVDAIAPAGGDDGREALGEALADAAAVEEDRCAAAPRHLFPDRPGDDVAGGQLSPGVGVEKEAAPVCVHDQSALATNRLADEEGRAPASARTVGWNWMNSTSATSAPAS